VFLPRRGHEAGFETALLRRGFNELYMALNYRISNRCVEDEQAETGKAEEISACASAEETSGEKA
jgi:hypothetical protein